MTGLLGAACGSSAPQAGTAVTIAPAEAAASVDGGDETAAAGAPPSADEITATGDQATDDGADGVDGADDGDTIDGDDIESDDIDAGPAIAPAGSPAAGPGTVRPAWLGTRVLPTDAAGRVPPQATPPELELRRFPTIDILPAPTDNEFRASIEPLGDEVLARSTWAEGCPVGVDDLRYVRMTFWGFDDRSHEGEMIVHRDVAEDVVGVFRSLHAARFPIEEMRVTAPDELDAPPTGDGNNTTSFVCRAVVGGTRFSEHASGLAVDINPFQNPYRKGDVVLPELATSYLDRSQARPGMIFEGGVVVAAFDAIGWGWGGRWQSLDDYHHFSLNNR